MPGVWVACELARLLRVAVGTVAACVISHHHFISQKKFKWKKKPHTQRHKNTHPGSCWTEPQDPGDVNVGTMLVLGIAVKTGWVKLECESGFLLVLPGQGDSSQHFR